MVRDLLEATSSPRREPVMNKVVIAELFETAHVESVFQMFERQCKVQYYSVCE